MGDVKNIVETNKIISELIDSEVVLISVKDNVEIKKRILKRYIKLMQN